MTATRDCVAIVTGAASGIGRATAKLLARVSAGLVLHTRGSEASRARLAEVAAAARGDGCEVVEAFGDLAEPGQGAALVATALEKFGRLDQIVSNAGYSDRRGPADIGRADLDRANATMAGALLDLAQAAMPSLRKSSQGRIVVVSSFVAHRFVEAGSFASSAAAKAALEALTKSLASALARDRVTVNAVVPGYTRKDGGHSALNPDAWTKAAEITPMGRLAEPEDVAHLIAFLISAKARHITGQAIAVDGGLLLG